VKKHRTTSTIAHALRAAHVIASEDENRDLGFGSVVASESRQRLLNRDGSFNVYRIGLGFLASLSPYHLLISASWKKFFSIAVVAYFIINFIFAFAYILCGPGALAGPDGSAYGDTFLRAFFFSVETFSTVGYGTINPTGVAANMVVTAECLIGILFVALATGLIFARFSRPTAKIIYSDKAVVAPYRGITAFMFRTINGRNSQIIELHASVVLSKFENVDGRLVRRFYPLKLERDQVVFFPLAWTVVHPIDPESPFYGLTERDLKDSNAEVLIVISGTDEIFSQTVYSRVSYTADEIAWNARFSDIFNRSDESGLLTVDIKSLHKIEPVPAVPDESHPQEESAADVRG
jgi:inward rectifier potassium channel